MSHPQVISDVSGLKVGIACRPPSERSGHQRRNGKRRVFGSAIQSSDEGWTANASQKNPSVRSAEKYRQVL